MKATIPLSIATIIASLSLGSCRDYLNEQDKAREIEERAHAAQERAGNDELEAEAQKAQPSPDPAPLKEEQSSPVEQGSPEDETSAAEEIAELEKEIQNLEQNIEGLEAAVQMERTKLEDNPDYDQSFLNETLLEQERDRRKIEKVREQIEELSGGEIRRD